MKIIYIICTFLYFSFLTAYSQQVISLNSLFTEQDALLIPEIEGYWKMTDLDWVMSLKKAGDNFYHFIDDVNNPSTKFEAVFVKINDELYLDLKGRLPESLGNTFYRDSFLPYHSIYKLKLLDGTLLISSLNYSWFYTNAVKKKEPIKYEWLNQGMMLTYSTDEFKSFFAEHLNEDGIFNKPDTLIVDTINNFKEINAMSSKLKTNKSILLSQNCVPKFPFKDGWLGGDGDVSVPINDTTTVFIFSDTYVGNKNQKSRKESGIKMVSNSVSVQTCLPNGETRVIYYWNNMYSDNPKPFFKTYTNRYKYWVVDAFIANSNMYVLLGKIGSKLGAAPDDIFNFSGLGYTLAKINNPYDIPYEWNINLYQLPDFYNSTIEIGCHVKMNDFIYFFINQNDTNQYLIRKQIDLIDNPELPFEYYSRNKKWKLGINIDDMYKVATGFRCNSVNFHPEIKKWVMISDIRFKDNKIKMRTSQTITGPWSKEILIYEIPEVTPGNSLYSESNFCYLAREHMQYYDPKNHIMLLTYDINNPNFSKIVASPNIYTPKVILVPLVNKHN